MIYYNKLILHYKNNICIHHQNMNLFQNLMEFYNLSFLFDMYYLNQPIRKVGISVGGLTTKESIQLNLFQDLAEIEKEDNKNKVIDDITSKYGKNSILKASALLSDSTIKERNKKIGGHSE